MLPSGVKNERQRATRKLCKVRTLKGRGLCSAGRDRAKPARRNAAAWAKGELPKSNCSLFLLEEGDESRPHLILDTAIGLAESDG